MRCGALVSGTGGVAQGREKGAATHCPPRGAGRGQTAQTVAAVLVARCQARSNIRVKIITWPSAKPGHEALNHCWNMAVRFCCCCQRKPSPEQM